MNQITRNQREPKGASDRLFAIRHQGTSEVLLKSLIAKQANRPPTTLAGKPELIWEWAIGREMILSLSNPNMPIAQKELFQTMGTASKENAGDWVFAEILN